MLHLSLSRGGETRQATQNEQVLQSFLEEGAFLELEDELFVHEEGEGEAGVDGASAYLETSAYIEGVYPF